MKRATYAAVAAALSIIVSYFLLRFVWQWYEPNHVKSDSDISDFMIAGLVTQAVCMVGAGVATYKWTGRRRGDSRSLEDR